MREMETVCLDLKKVGGMVVYGRIKRTPVMRTRRRGFSQSVMVMADGPLRLFIIIMHHIYESKIRVSIKMWYWAFSTGK